MRNEAVFRGKRPSPTFCLQKIQIAFRESRLETPIPDQGITGTRPSVKRTYQWRRPPPGFLKCNSDAGLNMQQHKAMASYMFRDERGDLTCGYTKRLYTLKSLIAEALALREAALMAANLKMEKILFESDNLQLIEVCLRRRQVGSIKHIIEDIFTWKAEYPNWGFTWTGRSGNHSAHTLANLALHGKLPSSWFWNPPNELRSALSRDKQHSQEYRIRRRTDQDGGGA